MNTRNPLLFPDIFQNILDHLYQFPTHLPNTLYGYLDGRLGDQGGRAALLALAQTCRSFSEPSLDRLWRKLISLKPLIQCYGGDPTIEWQPDKKKLTPPTSGELNIIRRYSTRIRTLYLRDSPSMLLLRHIGLQSSSFLLNLTCLVYDETHPSHFGVPTVPMATLACLLNPRVTSLEVVFAKTVDGAEEILRDLHQSCPYLRTLTFEVKPDRGRRYTLYHIPDFSRFKSLQYISLQAFIDRITFENLSVSSLAQVFSAAVRHSQSTPLETSLGPSDIPFRHAKHLTLRVWDLDIVTNLLRPLGQAFEYIDISIDGDRPTASSVDAFFKALASGGHVDSLRTIQLTQPLSSQSTPGCLSSDLPSLLTSFRRLETLVIDLGNISIDDDQLADLGSLRSLQILKLTCRAASWPLVQRPTLHGVLSLIGSCQQLEELALCVDARHVPRDADVDICNTTLKTLTFMDSPIQNSRHVAQFLTRHLPSVKRVSTPCSVKRSPWHNWGRWYTVDLKLHWGLDEGEDEDGGGGGA